ncbi:MAG: hypothetical protein EOM10_13020 [Opitutae bacterium]|nr:hypothetical protein [Opitutae bacterium]
MAIAEVHLVRGRYVLFVGGLAVATEVDPLLPIDPSQPIATEDPEPLSVCGQQCAVVDSFRPDGWRKRALELAAERINELAERGES